MARDRQRSRQRRTRSPVDPPVPVESAADDDEAFDPEDDNFERAPDEAEENLVPAGGGGAGRGSGLPPVAEGHPGRRERGRLLTFLRHCVDELRRVQWPDRKHVFQATAVVLGFVLIAGGWLGLMDAIWQPLINAIL
jgi:preprotein translocase SecE subunit